MNFKVLLIAFVLIQCTLKEKGKSETSQENYLVPKIVQNTSLPDSMLIHRGILSNDLKEYYIVVSNKSFENFDIKVSQKNTGGWDEPKEAWFNSEYDDHGLSFSPNGRTLVFSSTRPTNNDRVAATWHLWQSKYENGSWTDPEFIDIPNLRDKLVSHPTLSPDGTLYYHASNPDYTDMGIYFSKQENGEYSEGVKLSFESIESGTCTPYVTNDGKFLFFAAIEESLPIYYLAKTNDGWSSPIMLPKNIIGKSQANPFLTSDNQYLLFAYEEVSGNWKINCVETSSFIEGITTD